MPQCVTSYNFEMEKYFKLAGGKGYIEKKFIPCHLQVLYIQVAYAKITIYIYIIDYIYDLYNLFSKHSIWHNKAHDQCKPGIPGGHLIAQHFAYSLLYVSCCYILRHHDLRLGFALKPTHMLHSNLDRAIKNQLCLMTWGFIVPFVLYTYTKIKSYIHIYILCKQEFIIESNTF